ncbi:MAG: adenylate kinase family protein [Acidobacteriota bacterium]
MQVKAPIAVVMMGPPGSGKGTQSSRLSAFLQIPKISTGDMLRQIASEEGSNSEKIREIMATGSFVSDDILADLISHRLSKSDCEHGFILDGYPRNIDQAIFLEKLFLNKSYKLLAIEIKVPEDILVKRVTGRFSCKTCGAIYNKYFLKPQKEGVCDQCASSDFIYRLDDNEQVIKERIKEYAAKTTPVLDYYRMKDLLLSIDGNRSSDDIYRDLICQIGRV